MEMALTIEQLSHQEQGPDIGCILHDGKHCFSFFCRLNEFNCGNYLQDRGDWEKDAIPTNRGNEEHGRKDCKQNRS